MRRPLPYDMFDVERSANEARRLSKVGNIYHRGQKLVWDGTAVLDELWARHGGTGLTAPQREPARRILGAILWGELAAWKIAAQLADELEPLEARMAATSQAHDEARHFYVMHDYLVRATGDFPRGMPRHAERLIAAALGADTLAKKLIGMQLQLESTALTIFHSLREAQICPVLSDLLVYFEKDEARHVGLGTQLLPTLMRKMSAAERVRFSAYSFRMAGLSLASLKGSESDLRALGIDPRRVAVLGKSKQMLVFEELWALAPGMKSRIGELLGRGFDVAAELLWPDPGDGSSVDSSLSARARRLGNVVVHGYATVDTALDPATSARAPAPVPLRRVAGD
jgi:hypothetical protein